MTKNGAVMDNKFEQKKEKFREHQKCPETYRKQKISGCQVNLEKT